MFVRTVSWYDEVFVELSRSDQRCCYTRTVVKRGNGTPLLRFKGQLKIHSTATDIPKFNYIYRRMRAGAEDLSLDCMEFLSNKLFAMM